MLFGVDITYLLCFTAAPTGIIDKCQGCFAQFLPELADSTPGSAHDTPEPCYPELMLPASFASPQPPTGIISECQDHFTRFLPKLTDSAPGSLTLNLHISLPLPGHHFHNHFHLQTIYYCTCQLLTLQQIIVYLYCLLVPPPQLDRNWALLSNLLPQQQIYLLLTCILFLRYKSEPWLGKLWTLLPW